MEGGLYSAAMAASLALSWPLSSYKSKRKDISFWVWSGEEHNLWALHNSPLKVAMMVRGFWQDWGLMVIFVLLLMRCTLVEMVPLSSRVR